MADVSFSAASDAARRRLGERAYSHSLRVADVAAGLAMVYHADAAKAKVAGVLHDWDREIPTDEMLDRARDMGVEVSDLDQDAPHLLHARTAAAELRALLPELPDDVTNAVARHTVGAADMTELDMIVYIADMIEPGRHYPGIPALREAVGTVSLGELFAMCYQHTLGYLVAARRRIHPDTIAVWNALVAVETR